MIERVRDSTNEVGGNVLEMSGAEYMVRGLGYLRSLADLENVPVATKNGTPVLVRDLGTVSFGPDVRRGAADWQGEGETVGRHRRHALRHERAQRDSRCQSKAARNCTIAALRRGDCDRLRPLMADQRIHQHAQARSDRGSDHCQLRDASSSCSISARRSSPFSRCRSPWSRHSFPCTTCNVSSNIMSLGGLALADRGAHRRCDRDGGKRLRHLAERSDWRAGEHTEKLSSHEREHSGGRGEDRLARRSSSRSSSSWCRSFRSSCSKRRKAACSVPWPGPRRLALAFSSLLSITLVPALMPLFIRGQLRPESQESRGARHASHLSAGLALVPAALESR